MATTEQGMKSSSFLYGCDYNPDQWLDMPDVLNRDIELMREIGINTVNLGIFSWSRLEPAMGHYDFDWLRQVLDRLDAAHIGYFMATPGASLPPWLAAIYPEALRVDRAGCRAHPMARNHYCLTLPVLHKQLHLLCEAIAREVRYRPGLRGWHLDNELAGECCCPLCIRRWREWLKQRYQTLEALNCAWWSAFNGDWLSTWDDIPGPSAGHAFLPGMELDWRRFTTVQQVEWLKTQKYAVLPFTPDLPVTHNSWRIFGDFDWRKFAPELDFVSADVYMQYQGQPGDWMHAGYYAFLYSMYRNVKPGQNFMLMETTPSTAFVPPSSRQHRAGQLEVNVMEAVANGADGVSYFQWRPGRGGGEQYHGAILGHDGRADTRTARDVAALGNLLQTLADVRESTVVADAAIIYDPENAWILEAATLPVKSLSAAAEAIGVMRGCLANGIGADVTADTSEAVLMRYKVLFAPLLYMVDDARRQALENYVNAGGTLVLGAMSGWCEEHGLCECSGFPGKLRRLAGIRVETLDAWDDGELGSIAALMSPAEYPLRNAGKIPFRMLNSGREYYSRHAAELIHLETAEMLGMWTADDYLAGHPAVTVNRFGKGKVYYIGGLPNDEFRQALIRKLRDELGLAMGLPGVTPPAGVQIQRRRNGAREWVFLLNQSGRPCEVAGQQLPGYGTRVLAYPFSAQ